MSEIRSAHVGSYDRLTALKAKAEQISVWYDIDIVVIRGGENDNFDYKIVNPEMAHYPEGNVVFDTRK